MDPKTLARKKPVWVAISKFYLDTELGDDEITDISKTFHQSGYSIEELREINYEEVGPIVSPNLFSIAGVWTEFDEEWLTEKIIERISKGKSNAIFRKLYRRQLDRMTDRYWRKIIESNIASPSP